MALAARRAGRLNGRRLICVRVGDSPCHSRGGHAINLPTKPRGKNGWYSNEYAEIHGQPPAGPEDRHGRDAAGDDARRAARAGARRQDRTGDAGDRPARDLRRARCFRAGRLPDSGGRRHQDRQRDPSGRSHRQGQPIQSQPRRRSGERTDPRQQDRPDGGRAHPGYGQPGGRCLRDQRGALPVDRRAVAALFLRPQGQPGQGLQVDLSFLLGRRGADRDLHQHV